MKKMNHKTRVQIAIRAQAAADRSVAAIDDALAFVAASHSRIDAMEINKQLFGLVERDLTRDVYIGKIIGFPHQ